MKRNYRGEKRKTDKLFPKEKMRNGKDKLRQSPRYPPERFGLKEQTPVDKAKGFLL